MRKKGSWFFLDGWSCSNCGSWRRLGRVCQRKCSKVGSSRLRMGLMIKRKEKKKRGCEFIGEGKTHLAHVHHTSTKSAQNPFTNQPIQSRQPSPCGPGEAQRSSPCGPGEAQRSSP